LQITEFFDTIGLFTSDIARLLKELPKLLNNVANDFYEEDEQGNIKPKKNLRQHSKGKQNSLIRHAN
jgi:hypothetical protein